MLEYYFFKEALSRLDEIKKKDFILNDSTIFNYATFLDIGKYYRYNSLKKDKIKLEEKLDNLEEFPKFLTECLIEVNIHYSSEKLMLLYAMASSYILKIRIYPYLRTKVNETQSLDEILKMIDYIYTKKLDSWELNKIKLTKKFPDGFIYILDMYEAIHYPLIKIYKVFVNENYFKKCYKKKKKFYSFFTSSLYIIKLPYLKIMGLRLKNKRKKLTSYFYSNKIDTTILNKGKASYKIDNKEYKYTLDEQIELALKEATNLNEAIYDYVLFNKDKEIRKILKIDNNKRL